MQLCTQSAPELRELRTRVCFIVPAPYFLVYTSIQTGVPFLGQQLCAWISFVGAAGGGGGEGMEGEWAPSCVSSFHANSLRLSVSLLFTARFQETDCALWALRRRVFSVRHAPLAVGTCCEGNKGPRRARFVPVSRHVTSGTWIVVCPTR